MEKGFILLRNRIGDKSESMLGGMFRRVIGKQSTTNILKGELLEWIPDAILPGQNFQKLFNYRLVKDRTVAVYCSENDVAPLSDKEFLLLEAIQFQNARYEVFITGNKLEWGCGLKQGDRVYVSIPSRTVISDQNVAGAIRYVGGLPPDSGLMFGIEITDEQCRGHGTTDGTFRNERYFHCEDKCGLFVALDKLSMDPEGSILAKVPPGGQSYAVNTRESQAIKKRPWPSPRDLSNQRPEAGLPSSSGETVGFIPSSTDHQVHRSLSEGSTVQLHTFNETGHPQPRYGVIRWIGEITGLRGSVAGVELEEPMEGCTDGTFPMTGQKFFDCPERRGLYFPLAHLKPDERFTDPGTTPGAAVVANQLQQKQSLQEELVQQREEAKKKRQQLLELQQRLDSATAEKKSLQEQLVQQREEGTQTRQQLQQRLDGAAVEKKSLQEQLVQQREEGTQTRQYVQQLQQRLDGATAENHQLQQRLHDALSTSEQSQQRLDSASSELQGLQDIEPWKVSRDKVEIWTEIGSGGWGSVSEGTLRVAIKKLHHQILSPHYVDRLQREMRMLAQVRHPNLVQFLGVVLDEAALRLQEPPMIITELLDVNLRNAYERKLGFNKLSVFQDVARALNYLHERHDPIIHRDVSAPNVLLEALPNGMWKGKVSDLGSANLAKLAHTLAEGAIIYAAPETLPQFAHQAHGPRSAPPPQTTKIDVYSYGVLLCEVVTSRFPDPAQYHDMLGQVQRQWPFMYDLILSCTQHNPVERPTMSKVLTNLLQQ